MNIEEMPVKGKRVLVRVDFNVPLRDGKVADDTRITKSLNTINYLLKKGAKVTLCSHLGRPKGFDPKYSLKPVADKLREKGYKVILTLDCIGDSVYKALVHQEENVIVILENLRFHEEEKKADEIFAKNLAEPFDFFVQDAFGVCHRKAASTSVLPEILPSALGFLVREEIDKLNTALNPERPFVVVMGGSKISTKLGLIKNFLEKADKIILGGAMIFTFYKAMGMEIGRSLCEDDMVEEAKALLKNDKIVLPVDIVVSKSIEKPKEVRTVNFNKIEDTDYGLDIGEESVARFSKILSTAKMVLWNGPMGMFELKPFDEGTKKIARLLSEGNAKTIVGGGDSVAAINGLGLSEKFYHISTGGGASLEFLEGKDLPGIWAVEYA